MSKEEGKQVFALLPWTFLVGYSAVQKRRVGAMNGRAYQFSLAELVD